MKAHGRFFLLATAAGVFAMGTAAAELRIPTSVFKLDELEEAKSKAAADGEPLIFVLTNPGST